MSEMTFEEALIALLDYYEPEKAAPARNRHLVEACEAAHVREVQAARRQGAANCPCCTEDHVEARLEQARKDAHIAELHQGCGGRHRNPNRQCVSEVRDQILRSVEEKP